MVVDKFIKISHSIQKHEYNSQKLIVWSIMKRLYLLCNKIQLYIDVNYNHYQYVHKPVEVLKPILYY